MNRDEFNFKMYITHNLTSIDHLREVSGLSTDELMNPQTIRNPELSNIITRLRLRYSLEKTQAQVGTPEHLENNEEIFEAIPDAGGDHPR